MSQGAEHASDAVQVEQDAQEDRGDHAVLDRPGGVPAGADQQPDPADDRGEQDQPADEWSPQARLVSIQDFTSAASTIIRRSPRPQRPASSGAGSMRLISHRPARATRVNA
jgi:hypothetical protein